MNNSDNPIGWQHAQPLKATKDHEIFEWKNPGLTKREYFAGIFIQGILSAQTEMRGSGIQNDSFGGQVESLVTEALNFTDELLKQLENTK